MPYGDGTGAEASTFDPSPTLEAFLVGEVLCEERDLCAPITLASARAALALMPDHLIRRLNPRLAATGFSRSGIEWELRRLIDSLGGDFQVEGRLSPAAIAQEAEWRLAPRVASPMLRG